MALNIFNKLKKFFGSGLSNNNDDLDRSRKRSSDSPVTGASLVKYRMVNNTNSEFVSDTSDGIEQDLSTNTETVSPLPSSSFNHREKYAELLQTLAINCDTSQYAPSTSKNVNCSSQKAPQHSLCSERVNTTAHYNAPLSDCSVDLDEGSDECKVLTKSEQAVISQSNEIKEVDEICLNDNSSADEMELPKVTPVKSLMERFGLSCYLNKDWLKDFDITYWKKKDNEVKSTVEEKIVIDENKMFELNDQHHELIKRVLESPPDQVYSINLFSFISFQYRNFRCILTNSILTLQLETCAP
ncbi:uncharacterized protein LOC119687494 [Teleopsis dalmanni]|uniref:uncharacterized protein LOC119687494 n=1 Tax=Teleopsis dalmanni TaxID=139649 RepID=UPI0018CE1E4B|nr:uncharacterized protein LOC119687494 [Teleopsis dalmanni]